MAAGSTLFCLQTHADLYPSPVAVPEMIKDEGPAVPVLVDEFLSYQPFYDPFLCLLIGAPSAQAAPLMSLMQYSLAEQALIALCRSSSLFSSQPCFSALMNLSFPLISRQYPDLPVKSRGNSAAVSPARFSFTSSHRVPPGSRRSSATRRWPGSKQRIIVRHEQRLMGLMIKHVPVHCALFAVSDIGRVADDYIALRYVMPGLSPSRSPDQGH
jgi:hypothetical protein